MQPIEPGKGSEIILQDLQNDTPTDTLILTQKSDFYVTEL